MTILLMGSAVLLQVQKLKIYLVSKELLYTVHNGDCTVRLRRPGSELQDLFKYNVTVDFDKP